MKKILLFGMVLILGLNYHSYAQKNGKRMAKSLGPNPIYFVDSVRVSSLDSVNPNDLAFVSTYTNKEATDILGDEAKDGIVYMETKSFSRQRYWKYFKSKSEEYARIVPTAESDTIVQYIINNKVQTGSFFGNLALINDGIFKSIQIIDKETLIKDYGIEDKQYGVIIISDVPKGLYHAKKKF